MFPKYRRKNFPYRFLQYTTTLALEIQAVKSVTNLNVLTTRSGIHDYPCMSANHAIVANTNIFV